MKKIAIVRRNGLGDLLCALPLVLYLQKEEPEAEITLFIDPRNAALIPYLPSIDRVIVLPARGNKYFNLWRCARRFRGEFDLALCAKTSPMKLMNFFLYWLKAKKRVAYVDNRWHSRLVNHPLIFDYEKAKTQHQALKNLKMVAPQMEEIPEALYPKLRVNRQKRPVTLPQPVILVSATTTRVASRFDSKRYAAILNQLHADEPISVLIIGEPHDRARATAIASELRAPHYVHFPRSFDEFMLFLDTADLYFVGDGGIAHIGAALGKRGVVLFGETNPKEWHPLSREMEILYHPTDVDYLNDEKIFQALKRIKNCGRDNRYR